MTFAPEHVHVAICPNDVLQPQKADCVYSSQLTASSIDQGGSIGNRSGGKSVPQALVEEPVGLGVVYYFSGVSSAEVALQKWNSLLEVAAETRKNEENQRRLSEIRRREEMQEQRKLAERREQKLAQDWQKKVNNFPASVPGINKPAIVAGRTIALARRCEVDVNLINKYRSQEFDRLAPFQRVVMSVVMDNEFKSNPQGYSSSECGGVSSYVKRSIQ